MDRSSPITFLTEGTRTTSIAGFTFMDGWFAGGLHIPVHYHDGPTLAVILQGTFEERLSTHVYECRPGSLVVKPPGESHRDAFRAPGRCVALEFGAARMADLDAFVPSEAVYCQNEEAQTLAWHIARELRVSPLDSAALLTLEGLALELVAASARLPRLATRRGPHWLRQLVAMLQDSPCELPTIAAMADVAGVHPVHLARVFKTYQRRSLGAYARQLRLKWAGDRLLKTCEPIASIAAKAGFCDQSHFSRAFTLEMGFTPSVYRRQFGRQAGRSVPPGGAN